MRWIFWLISRGAIIGFWLVFIIVASAILWFLTQATDPVARWLLAAIFAQYWPFFIYHAVSQSDNREDDEFHAKTGCLGVIVVSLGCLFDFFFPRYVQRASGSMQDYDGLWWALAGYLLLGTIMSLSIVPSRPKSEQEP